MTTEAKDKTDRREIKFRCWNPVAKVMIDWQQMRDDHWDLWLQFRVARHMMQFTGLKDKTGKEIYEGDIVERFRFTDNNGGHKRSKVVFEDGSFKLSQTVKLNSKIIHTALVKVIGNIHENPELLSHERI